MTLMKKLLTLAAALLAAAAVRAQTTFQVTDSITLTQVSPHAWVHTSLADLGSFGGVYSNGLVVVSGGEALLLDTPANDVQTESLVRFLADSLHARVTLFMPNHWHSDCMGGLGHLQSLGVRSYAYRMTVEEARKHGLPVPDHGFAKSLTLKVGTIKVICRYEGGGHTPDNTVAWIPSEGVLFGGCLVKDAKATWIGNTSDADMAAWPGTMERVCKRYKKATVVVPGHGPWGGTELLTHTLELVSAQPAETEDAK